MPSSVSAAAKRRREPDGVEGRVHPQGDPRGDERVRQAQLVRALPRQHEGRALGLGDHHDGVLATPAALVDHEDVAAVVQLGRHARQQHRQVGLAGAVTERPAGRPRRASPRSAVNSAPGPVGVPRLQLESRQPGHQVQLGRPDVAVRAAAEPGLLVSSKRDVVRDDVLAQDVVGVDEQVPRLADTSTVASRSGGSRRRSGTQSSTTNRPPGSRCRAALRKHATCSSWVSRLEMVLKTR